MSDNVVKTDEKKQHFDDIYVEPTPVPYKEKILDKLEYVSDNFNRQTFDRLILEWAKNKAANDGPIRFVDLAGCFGNTTLATLYGMTYDDIRDNWKSEAECFKINGARRFEAVTTGIDQSTNALAYGRSAGIYDNTIEADLNNPSEDAAKELRSTLINADVLICTAALVYFTTDTIRKLVGSFAEGKTGAGGFMLVNFLNPFALEKADETKRILLEYLDFVGSIASRHRRLSPLEIENYPGEEWALLEIWVLKRKE